MEPTVSKRSAVYWLLLLQGSGLPMSLMVDAANRSADIYVTRAKAKEGK